MVKVREARTPNHTENVDVGHYMAVEGEKITKWAKKNAPDKIDFIQRYLADGLREVIIFNVMKIL